MPIVITPRSLNQRAELYHQLGSMITAGVGLPQAIDELQRAPPAPSFRRPLAQINTHLQQGDSFAEALGRLRSWPPPFDVALIESGEKSGRLEASLKLLSNYYEERARLLRSVMSQLIWPVFTLHVAILVFPVSLLQKLALDLDFWAFSWAKIKAMTPLYGIVFLFVYACQGARGEWWRAMLENATRLLPVLGAARRHLALARLAAALEALISAGVSIVNAWDIAADASGSPALRRAVRAWKPRVLGGATPAEALRACAEFPNMFRSLYATGELSGQLDDTLRRLYTHYQESGSRKLKAAAEWTPRLIYLGIMVAIAFSIISFWLGYFGNILSSF
jgi:type II secretory pathway component PulF